ncbi:MAG TPA: hypothetical protein VNX68_17420 [Nitrosopumilaceae archaeon]|nr:hypothetical protein [Nitrosopumilaceae archaeon]
MDSPIITKLVVTTIPIVGNEISTGIILALLSTNLLAKFKNMDFVPINIIAMPRLFWRIYKDLRHIVQ